MEFFTMGVYGLTAEYFFEKLAVNEIDTFIDIRRRRAVRGSKFSFVNSIKLQRKLHEMGIKYLHILDLAPTNEIRDLQKEADNVLRIKKRARNELGDTFISEYKKSILSKYDLLELIGKLNGMSSQKSLLFCVETNPKACHRYLVSEKLQYEFDIKTTHI